MVNLLAIRGELEKDLYVHKVCESCENSPSEYLYIVENLFFGIFHICEECKNFMEFSEMPDLKNTFLKKFQAICWADFEEAPKDTPLR